jgi:hypothetical protein
MEPPPQSEYTDLRAQLAQSATFLSRMKKADAKAMRLFLINDLYPMVAKIMEATEWYVMDLHTRVSNLEEGEDTETGIDEESAGKIIEFVGRSVQVFGALMTWAKDNSVAIPEEVVTEIQLLVTSAPGLMMMVQDMTAEEDEDEDEYEEENGAEPEGLVEPSIVPGPQPVEEPAPEAPAAEAAPAEPEPPAAEPPAEPEPVEEPPAAPEPPAEAAPPVDAAPAEPVELTPPAETPEGGES